jgi:LysM repeat protein
LRKNSITGSKSGKNPKSQRIRPIFLTIYTKWFMVFLFVFNFISVFPTTANAGFISFVSDLFSGGSQKTLEVQNDSLNSQNIPLLTNPINLGSNAAVGGGDINTADDGEALVAESGPSGTLADIGDTVNTGQISKYTVRKGDSLGSIAKMYGVTTNTIIWANNITSSIKEGQSLIILPVSGTLHTIVKGDTLRSIAKKYKADAGEISQFNDLNSSVALNPGDTIVIPDGEGTVGVSGTTRSSARGTSPYRGGSGPDYPGYYIRPILGGIKTQGMLNNITA